MSTEDSRHVYRLHSTLELPLEDLREHIDDAAFPDRIDDVEITRRNNTLILKAVAEDQSVSKYTPSAQLKASVTENRVYEEDPDERRNSFRWDEEEDEIESELVEFAAFKGDRETVLQNSLLQYEMFLVLCEIAEAAEKGTLTAISEHDGDLEATRIVEESHVPRTSKLSRDPRSRLRRFRRQLAGQQVHHRLTDYFFPAAISVDQPRASTVLKAVAVFESRQYRTAGSPRQASTTGSTRTTPPHSTLQCRLAKAIADSARLEGGRNRDDSYEKEVRNAAGDGGTTA